MRVSLIDCIIRSECTMNTNRFRASRCRTRLRYQAEMLGYLGILNQQIRKTAGVDVTVVRIGLLDVSMDKARWIVDYRWMSKVVEPFLFSAAPLPRILDNAMGWVVNTNTE